MSRVLLITLLTNRCDIQIIVVSSKFNSMATSTSILKMQINHPLPYLCCTRLAANSLSMWYDVSRLTVDLWAYMIISMKLLLTTVKLCRLVAIAGYQKDTLVVSMRHIVCEQIVFGYDRLVVHIHRLWLNGLCCRTPLRLSESTCLYHDIIHIFMNNL